MAEDLRELSEIEKIKQRIAELNKQEEKYAQKSSQYSKRKLSEVKKEKEEQQKLLKVEEQRLKTQQSLEKEQISFAKSFAKLGNDVKKLLKDQNTETSIYQSLGNDIAKSKVKQLSLTGDELEAEMEREQYLSQINDSLLQQAKEVAKAEADARGLNEFEQRRIELKQNALGLSEEELRKAEQAINLEEQMFQKKQRLNELEKIGGDLMSQMPDGLQKAIGFAKGLFNAIKTGMGPLFLIGALLAAAVKSFIDLDSAAADFRKETGLTNSQMDGIKSDVNEIVADYAHLGVNAKAVFDTVSALKSEFSDIADFSQETTAALTVLSTNFGVSAESAAKVQGVLEQVSGLSSETAASVQLQVANMAKMAGVAPAKVMADIAESAEIASTLFKGDTQALAQNAIEARRLGTNLKSVAATAEKLLDFEGGIEEELTAATYVGGQFNLSRARALAFEGKIVEAQKETLSQIQRSGDFRKKDYFTQQQLAKAAGMSVEEINKQLNAQEKLNSLSDEQKKMAEDAINAGLDISNISEDQLASQVEQFSLQQEQQAAMDKLSNAFTGIASTVGSVLTPLLEALIPILDLILFPVQAISEGFKFFADNLAIAIPLAAGLAIAFAPAIIAAISSAVGFIMSSFAMIPFGIGIPLGIAAVAGLFSMLTKAKSAGDMMSPADGKTQVSTKEGGLFELSPNDDLVAAPGAAAALSGANGGEGGGGGVNLSVLAAPLQAVVTEIKALRADLSAGKIAVYMDSQKVTNGVSKTVDQSTRNSYNLGTV